MLTRKMKDSGVEWIGEIPENWEVKKVKYMFRIVNGNGFPENLQGEKEGDYPFYKNSDINKLGIYINKSNNYISKNTATINKFTVIPSKSILIGKIGEALKRNHRKINLSECMIDNNMMALVPKENELFSYYLLTTIDIFWFDNNGTIPSINSNKLRNFKIPYVNKTLQKNIVEILNKKTQKIDKLISSTQQSIEELKKYKQSLITEAVTKGLNSNVEMKDSGIEWIGKIPKHWSMSRIKNKFTLNKGLTITKSDLKDKGIPVINYGEIHSKYGFRFDTEIHPVKNVDEEYLTKNENSLIKKGDFIFADTSEDLDGSGNFTCYIGDTQCFAGSHTVILKPRKNINHLYFSYLFESLAFRAQIQEKVQGIKVFSITQGILKPLTLIIPTEQEQEQIVSYLDEQTARIDKLIEDKTKVIEELEDYKKSLIYEYVTGKKEV